MDNINNINDNNGRCSEGPLLMCYGWAAFGVVIKGRGWKDGSLPDDWVFIEIGDSEGRDRGDEPFRLEECGSVIRLRFDDIAGATMKDAEPGRKWTDAEWKRYENVRGMSADDASRLFEFIDTNIGKNIMVHCSAGVSRSQGVVRFVLDCYPDVYGEERTNSKNPCLTPNMYVTAMLKRKFYERYPMFDGPKEEER